MASLTSNPMEEMMDEDELQQQQEKASLGYRRSWSNPGPEEMQRPNTLRLCSGQDTYMIIILYSTNQIGHLDIHLNF